MGYFAKIAPLAPPKEAGKMAQAKFWAQEFGLTARIAGSRLMHPRLFAEQTRNMEAYQAEQDDQIAAQLREEEEEAAIAEQEELEDWLEVHGDPLRLESGRENQREC